jgi:cell division protein FtsQ
MAEIERDSQQRNSDNGTGRARKRKIQRQIALHNQSQVESPMGEIKAARQRTARRSSPTLREERAQGQLKAQPTASPTFEEKLSSSLGLDRRSSRHSTRARKEHTEPLFKATRHTETQRVLNSDRGTLPPKNRKVYEAHSEAAPPVMVRGGMNGMAFGRVASNRLQKTHTPKRRIDVPLRIPGAEVRLPSVPFVNLGWRSISLGLAILMSICLFLMWKAPMFQVSSVEAQGIKRLSTGDLNVVMGTIGKSVFSLNPTLLRDVLSQAFPELSKISVRVGLPASVKVVVTERQPVLSWFQDGVESWVDADGVSFPVRGVPDTPLVVVEGYGTPPGPVSAASSESSTTSVPLPTALDMQNPSLRLSPELVAAILTLGAKMPPDTALVYDSQRGLGWNDPNGWEVFFGNEDQDMDMKMAVYQALVERLKSEGIQPALISVEYVHAPYYRMER